MIMIRIRDLPVAVIGAGPVGLAAAAHLVAARHPPARLRAGPERRRSAPRMGRMCASFRPGATTSMRRRARLLERSGWKAPDADRAADRRQRSSRDYLRTARCASGDRPQSEARRDRHGDHPRRVTTRCRTKARQARPSSSATKTPAASIACCARAVIDASGTWSRPNPIGIDGLPVPGEREAADRIAYGIPDVAGPSAERLCRKARAGHRRRPFGDQRGAGTDGAAARSAGHRNLLGAAPQRRRKAARRRAERPVAGARRARPRRQAGDAGRPAEHAGALRRRAHRDAGRRPRRRSHA